jgi:hypothetical protein
MMAPGRDGGGGGGGAEEMQGEGKAAWFLRCGFVWRKFPEEAVVRCERFSSRSLVEMKMNPSAADRVKRCCGVRDC